MRILALILVLVSTAAFAETKVGIVDLKEVIDKSTAAASLRRQLATEQEGLKKQFEEKGQSFLKEEEKLIQQQSILSQEAFAEKQEAFRTKVLETQKNLKEKGNKLDKASKEGLTKIKNTISEIVDSIAKRDNLDLVLSSAVTLYSNDKMSMTEEVIEQLNEKLPDVQIEVK